MGVGRAECRQAGVGCLSTILDTINIYDYLNHKRRQAVCGLRINHIRYN